MRHSSCLLLLLWFASLAGAAPVEAEGALPRADATESRQFAVQLHDLAASISQTYVKSVPRARLLTSALEGLYREARLTPPANLLAELEQQIPEPTTPAEPPAPGIVVQPEQNAIALLARYRQEAGNGPGLRGSGALRVSLEAMLQSLDPFSCLITGEELRRGRGENTNLGFGFDWTDAGDGVLQVKSVAIGGPAQRAGLRPGDQLKVVDFHSPRVPKEMARPEALPGFLRLAQPGDRADLIVRRSGAAARQLRLDHDYFQAETAFGVRRRDDGAWNHWIDAKKKIGYVRVGPLEKGTADAVERSVTDLKSEGLRGLVLDLRWSPGGFLNEAVLLGRMFIKDGAITRIESRYRQDDQEYSARGGEAFDGFPLVVLVNAETSGGAELIAAALRDSGRALVAGQRSRGKASVQTTLPVPIADTGLKITTGQFLRPSGKPLHRHPTSRPQDDWGVRPEPDLETPIDPTLSRQLADEYLKICLRPGAGKEALLLDDPDQDPQRQEAVRKVIELARESRERTGR